MDDDPTRIASEMAREWEQTMSRWWNAVLGDPEAVRGMGRAVAAQARAKEQWEDGVDRSMEALHLPSRKDLIRLARIVSLLEDRLVALEDRALDQSDKLDEIYKDALKARVDAAEARLSIDDRLAAIEAKLDALAARLTRGSGS
jgi:hypothetical protein